MEELNSLKTLFRLLSEEVRIRILCLLRESELHVSEIQKILKLKQSNLSSHLNQLKEHGLLQSRREGQYSYYKLTAPVEKKFPLLFEEVTKAACLESWYETDLQLREQIIQQRRESVLEYFQSDDGEQGLAAPGQDIDVLAVGFLTKWKDKRIIDLGCGRGRLARLYALAGGHVTGVDNSSRQIEIARELDVEVVKTFATTTNAHDWAEDKGEGVIVRPITYLCENMEKTSMPSGQADLVVISHALHHVSEPMRSLREAARLLKPSGELLIIDLVEHQNESLRARFGDFWLGFSVSAFAMWLRELGFRILSQHVLRNYVCRERVLPFMISACKVPPTLANQSSK